MTDAPNPFSAPLALHGVRAEAADLDRLGMLAERITADAAHLRRAFPLSLEPLNGPLSGRPEEPDA